MAARSPRRGFVGALAASLVLHALTLALGPARLGGQGVQRADPLPQQLAMRLLPPATTAAGPRTLLPPAQAAQPAAAPTRRAPPPLPVTGPPPVAAEANPSASAASAAHAAPGEVPVAPPPLARSEPASAPSTPSTAASTDAGTPPTNAVVSGAPAAATGPNASPPPGSIRFPRSGRLEYAVTVGDPPAPVGRATYAWEASNEAYRLSLTAETTGLVGLLRRVRVVQTSEGRITADGVRPDAFAMDRGPKARNEFARFDWPAKQVSFGYPDAVQTAPLAAGAQDTLSLILQFAFVPIEQGRRDVLLTTGRKVYVQAYERVAEEIVETPSGGWRAWHLRRVRAQAGDEGYDMWLATDRPYLPVRIRWTDRNGRVTSATLDTVRLAQD